jgi:hypothetical protein
MGSVRAGSRNSRATAFFFVLGLFAATSWAQPAAVQVAHFTVFSAKPIPELGFVPRQGVAAQKVTFSPTARSPRYEFSGAMPVRFVDLISGAVVAEANIPAGIRDALLLFTPVESAGASATAASKGAAGLAYQVAVLDDGATRHGPGGLAIINLSGLTLSGSVNKETVTLKTGLNPTIAVGKAAKISLTTIFKQKTYHAYAGEVKLGPTDRALLILFPPFYQGGLEVQSRLLVDQPPGTVKPKAPAAKTPAATTPASKTPVPKR